jgi:site-specific recombinase XerD
LMSIRALFNDALEGKQVRRNPASAVKERDLPETARVRYCDRDLRDKLIRESPTEELQYVLMCGFHAGLRKNEIIESVPWWFHLTLRHIDLRSTPTLRFNDKKQARDIPMRNIMHEFLSVYGLREPFMLRPDVSRGKNIYRYDFAKPFRAYMQSQAVPWVTPHVMRHTFASLLVIDGRSIFKVAKWLGDSVIVTEKVYAHLAPSDPDVEECEAGSSSTSNLSSA